MADGIIIEGPIFKLLNDIEILYVFPRLQDLTRPSPEDKKILVEKLKSLRKLSVLPETAQTMGLL
jgi:Ca2+-transporting ATPase